MPCSLTGVVRLKEVTSAEECARSAPASSDGIVYMLKGKEYVWTVDVYDEHNHRLTHDVCEGCVDDVIKSVHLAVTCSLYVIQERIFFGVQLLSSFGCALVRFRPRLLDAHAISSHCKITHTGGISHKIMVYICRL